MKILEEMYSKKSKLIQQLNDCTAEGKLINYDAYRRKYTGCKRKPKVTSS